MASNYVFAKHKTVNWILFIFLETSHLPHKLANDLATAKWDSVANKIEQETPSVPCWMNLTAGKAHLGQTCGSTGNQTLHHLWWILLGMFGQLNPQLASLDSAVRNTAAALFLGENLNDAFAICPQTGPLHHRLTHWTEQTYAALVEANQICALCLHVFCQLGGLPWTCSNWVLEAKQSAPAVLLQATVHRLVDHLVCLLLTPGFLCPWHPWKIPHRHQRAEEGAWRRCHQETRLQMPKQLLSNLAVVSLQCIPAMHQIQGHITPQPKFLSCHWNQARATVEFHDVMRSHLGFLQKCQGFVQTSRVLLDGFELLSSKLGLLLHMSLLHWPWLGWSCLALLSRGARLLHGFRLFGMLMRAEVQTALDVAAWGQRQLWTIFLGLRAAIKILQFQQLLDC